MIQQRGLVHRAGVVVQAPGDGEVHGEVLRRNAEGGQVLHHGVQLVKTLVEHLVPAAVALQRGEHLIVAAADGDEGQNFIRFLRIHAALVHQQGPDLLGADLVQLVHGAHDVAGLLRQTQHSVEAIENFAVVHTDLEPLQAQGGERLVDDGGNLRLIGDVQLAVADDVDVRLIELAEPAALRPLAAVYLADLIAAEGEGQVVVVQGHILGKRHRQIKAQRQVGVALLEAVDLFFRLAAALGQQYLAGLDHRRVQRRKAVQAVRPAEDIHHPFHLLLRLGQ